MAEENTAEETGAEENTVEATEAEAPKGKKAKKEKAEKPAKPQERYWCGSKAAREGAVYNRLQVVVAAHPGLTRSEIIGKLREEGFSAKNSKKFEENPEQFIGGYLTAGARKGFFTNSADTAVAAPATLAVEKKEKAEKGPSVSESGRLVLTALQTSLGDRFEAGNGIPVSELAEAMGKTKTQLTRTIDKLVKDQMVEVDTVGTGDEAQDYVYVQEKGAALITQPAA